GYWRLDEGAGLTAVDRTTNGNDGSLVNGPTWASAVAPAFNSDSFIYQADDAHGGTATANVTITITQGNVAPIAVNDTYSVVQGITFTAPAPGVLGNDTDANNDILTASLVTGPGNGTLTLNLDGSFDYTSGAGMVFNAGGLVLAGTDDYVSVPDAPSLNPAAVTVEAWAKFDSLADRPHLVGKGTGSQGAYWLVVETNGTPRFFYTKSGETWSAVNGAAGDIVPGVWYHFAGVYDGTNATIYVNGVAMGTVVNAGTLATTDPNPVWFGRNSGGTDSFAGMLDEVRIWNVARTAAELQAAMNTPLTGAEAGLAGYWRLDEGAGLTAVDRTTNGNDGSLVNGPTWASAVAPAFNSDSFIYQADDGNGATALATVSITVTNAAPTVSISAPADSAPVTGMVAITATAADDNSVSQVEFFVDGVSIGLGADMGGGTWSINWDTSGVISPPTHSLTAVATDVTARSTTSAPAVVTVTNAAPTASITAPIDLASVTGMVAITAAATDDNAVTQVEFFADAVSIGLGTDMGGGTWSINWDTSALADLSTHSLTAVAADAAAQTGASAAVSVTVSNAAPTVSITAPVDLASVTGLVAITATANDDNAVTQVEFFVDDGTTTTSL
ncbi:MAG: Ig-like domain-containing protein, partial [Chloroflexota bacterium]